MQTKTYTSNEELQEFSYSDELREIVTQDDVGELKIDEQLR